MGFVLEFPSTSHRLFFTLVFFLLTACGGGVRWENTDKPICTTGASFWDAGFTFGGISYSLINYPNGNNGSMSPGISIGTGPWASSFVFTYKDLITVPSSTNLNLNSTFTLSLWGKPKRPSNVPAGPQTLMGRWGHASATSFGTWAGVDFSGASILNNATLKGYSSATFDGRYIYLTPNYDGTVNHGKVVRYDTTQSLTLAAAWSFFDAGNIDALTTKGFHGSVFDGRYVYFVPNNNGAYSGNVLRYDTKQTFSSAASWSAFDASTIDSGAKGFYGGVYDGRYVYFVPNNDGTFNGVILRYDTAAPFYNTSSWAAYDLEINVNSVGKGFAGGVFDGRYLYLAPHNGGTSGTVFRYDTTLTFNNSGSWNYYDAGNTNGSSTNLGYSGGVFDGRYIYFVPQAGGSYHGNVLRYDTLSPFSSPGSWSSADTTSLIGANYKGFRGGTFDGRYIYFIPNNNSAYHGNTARYDSFGSFGSASSWLGVDISGAAALNDTNYRGFVGALFDGQYVYYIPQYNVSGSSHIVRLDVRNSENSYLIQQSSATSDGLSSSNLGPRVTFKTSNGTFKVSSGSLNSASWHHYAVTYDGASLKFYIDGNLSVESPMSGAVSLSTLALGIGGLSPGVAGLQGELSKIQIFGSVLTASEIQSLSLGQDLGSCR